MPVTFKNRYDTTDIDEMAGLLRDLAAYMEENRELFYHTLQTLGWEKETIDETLLDPIIINIGQMRNLFDTAAAGTSDLLQGAKLNQFKASIADRSFIERFGDIFNGETIDGLTDSLQQLEYALQQEQSEIDENVAKGAFANPHDEEQMETAAERVDDAVATVVKISNLLNQVRHGLEIGTEGVGDPGAARELLELLEDAHRDIADKEHRSK